MIDQVRIDEVLVGERARKDYGDLTSLMESISEHGLLQPIGLAPGNHLLFGGRRLEACRRLGHVVIDVTRPATQDDALSLLKAERDENTCRKDMTTEELVDLGLRLEVMERAKGRAAISTAVSEANRARSGQVSSAEETWPPATHHATAPTSHKTDRVVGEALGMSNVQYFRAKSVVRASRDPESPKAQEAAQIALAKIAAGEETVSGGYSKVREVKREEAGIPAAKKPALTAAPDRPPVPTRYGPRRKHAQVIEALVTSLSGLAAAAEEIKEIDQSVTSEEAARLTSDLSRQIRTLQALNNRLKERTK